MSHGWCVLNKFELWVSGFESGVLAEHCVSMFCQNSKSYLISRKVPTYGGKVMENRLLLQFGYSESHLSYSDKTATFAATPTTDAGKKELEAFEDEVIDRLFALNAERAEEEVRRAFSMADSAASVDRDSESYGMVTARLCRALRTDPENDEARLRLLTLMAAAR